MEISRNMGIGISWRFFVRIWCVCGVVSWISIFSIGTAHSFSYLAHTLYWYLCICLFCLYGCIWLARRLADTWEMYRNQFDSAQRQLNVRYGIKHVAHAGVAYIWVILHSQQAHTIIIINTLHTFVSHIPHNDAKTHPHGERERE